MNCSEVRASLPLLLYDDLSPAEKALVEKHLADCPGCQREYRALQGVRQTLGLAAAPGVEIDLPQLYRRAAERQERRLRRWRRLALAAASVAALVGLLILGPHLEARFEAHQLVLRWGSAQEAATLVPARASEKTAALADLSSNAAAQGAEEQLRLLSDLIRALADNVQSVENRERHNSAELLARLLAMQQQSTQRWTALERNVDSLYQSLQKGE
jgi:anti-sigma factor RsiW